MSVLDRVPVDPALVERFRCDLLAALGRTLGMDERIALAVSGGPDSMAMLVLAAAALPGQVVAATVDHGLRAEAADEAAMVAAHAARIDVPHATLRITAPPAAGDNVQAWARERRYDVLARWAVDACASCLATAHHADDQAETFLMRAARGSGVAGLAGIRVRQCLSFSRGDESGMAVAGGGDEGLAHSASPADTTQSIALIRPLLGWRVAELRAFAIARHAPFVDDPSNADPHYDRTRFRALLRDTPWLDPVQFARAAAHVAEADTAIREIEAWLWRTRRVAPEVAHDPDGQTWLDIASLPRELKRRLCRRAILSVRAAKAIERPDFDDSTNIEPLLDSLEAGKPATQAGIMVTPRGSVWRFAEQPPRRPL